MPVRHLSWTDRAAKGTREDVSHQMQAHLDQRVLPSDGKHLIRHLLDDSGTGVVVLVHPAADEQCSVEEGAAQENLAWNSDCYNTLHQTTFSPVRVWTEFDVAVTCRS